MAAPVLTAAPAAPTKFTTSPIVTGSSVIGVKFRGGVMLAADTLASYGGLARYPDARRLRRVGDYTLLGASGEYSDFQYIMDTMHEVVLAERLTDDGAKLTASEIHSYLSRVMYQRRNKGDPLYNRLVVAGHKDGASFLGYVDLLGTAFEDNYLATGYGTGLALPLLRDRWREDLSEAEARALLEDCLRVLWYRDCRALNRVQIAVISDAGPAISEPYVIAAKWDYRSFIAPKGAVDTGGSW